MLFYILYTDSFGIFGKRMVEVMLKTQQAWLCSAGQTVRKTYNETSPWLLTENSL